MKISFKPETAVNISSLLLRLSSATMLTHGWKKLSNFSTMSEKFSDPLHVGHTASLSMTIFAEFFCTIFLVLGLFTRIATIPLIICFAVIVLIVHAPDDFGEKELALVYLMLYIAIFILGPGKFSLDNAIRKVK